MGYIRSIFAVVIAAGLAFISWGAGGCGGGQTNFCADPNSVTADFAVLNETCAFDVNDDFTACFVNGEEASIIGLVTSGDVVNCTIREDSNDIVAADFFCGFEITSADTGDTYDCYAGVLGDGTPSGSIYCVLGDVGAPTDDCRIEYQ